MVGRIAAFYLATKRLAYAEMSTLCRSRMHHGWQREEPCMTVTLCYVRD